MSKVMSSAPHTPWGESDDFASNSACRNEISLRAASRSCRFQGRLPDQAACLRSRRSRVPVTFRVTRPQDDEPRPKAALWGPARCIADRVRGERWQKRQTCAATIKACPSGWSVRGCQGNPGSSMAPRTTAMHAHTCRAQVFPSTQCERRVAGRRNDRSECRCTRGHHPSRRDQ